MPRVPALAGVHEIAQMAGVSRQRAYQITGNQGFPAPVEELACGRIWVRDDVERYLAGRSPRAAETRAGRQGASGLSPTHGGQDSADQT